MTRHLRVDPTTGRRVILAPERLRRPGAGDPVGLPNVPACRCPFCPGHEAATTPTIAQQPADGPWAARAFANGFPALLVEGDPAGAHEVIVEVPEHDLMVWQGSPERLVPPLKLARDRMRDLSGDQRFAHFAWFRNHGIRAGSSQAHPHAQLVALPYVPDAVQRMVAHCVPDRFPRLIERAEADDRIVWQGQHILALCPFAPMYPFETWLVPTSGSPDFRDADDMVLTDLALAMHHVLGAMAEQLSELAYCAALFTRPVGYDTPGLAWHIRVQPRPEIHSGFSAATGDSINGVMPELAAHLLRTQS